MRDRWPSGAGDGAAVRVPPCAGVAVPAVTSGRSSAESPRCALGLHFESGILPSQHDS